MFSSVCSDDCFLDFFLKQLSERHLFPNSVNLSVPAAVFLSTAKPLLCVSGNYVLNYLATRPKLATFVTQALIQLYARITKLGWFDCQKDEYVFRNVITDVTRFLQVRI